MTRDNLLVLLAKEQRELSKSRQNRDEVNFILKYWQVFADNKSTIYAAIKGTSNLNGNDLCALLGTGEVFVEKCKDSELLGFCYSARSSKLYKKFLDKINLVRNCTIFYIAGKKSIVVTNKVQLDTQRDFTHRLTSLGNLADIYWSPVDSVADTLRVYNVSG